MVVGLYFQTSVSTIKCLKSLLCPLASKLLLSLVILAKGREGPRGRIQVADSCLAAVSSTVKSFTFSISISCWIPSLSPSSHQTHDQLFFPRYFYFLSKHLSCKLMSYTHLCQDSFNSNGCLLSKHLQAPKFPLCHTLKLWLLQHCSLSILPIPLLIHMGSQTSPRARGKC